MSNIQLKTTEMSESVQTETITKTEKNEDDGPSKKKSNILRHRKVPSIDLNNVSIVFYFYNF